MRDAARELADAFHLLRLARALVGGAPLGEVARDLRKTQELAPRGSLIALMTTLAQKLVPSLRTRQPSASYLPVCCRGRQRLVGSPPRRSFGV